eukprot:5589545-Prymnesium_polylepis.1
MRNSIGSCEPGIPQGPQCRLATSAPFSTTRWPCVAFKGGIGAPLHPITTRHGPAPPRARSSRGSWLRRRETAAAWPN